MVTPMIGRRGLLSKVRRWRADVGATLVLVLGLLVVAWFMVNG